MTDVGGNATLELEAVETRILLVFLRTHFTIIHDCNRHPPRKVGLLAEAREDGIHEELSRIEDLWIRRKRNNGTCPRGLAPRLHVRERFTPAVFLCVDSPIAVYFRLHMNGESIHNRRPHPMQPPGYLVTALIPSELSAGMKGGEDNLECRPLFLGMQINRNATAIVIHCH